jgi:hypothetical protein
LVTILQDLIEECSAALPTLDEQWFSNCVMPESIISLLNDLYLPGVLLVKYYKPLLITRP